MNLGSTDYTFEIRVLCATPSEGYESFILRQQRRLRQQRVGFISYPCYNTSSPGGTLDEQESRFEISGVVELS